MRDLFTDAVPVLLWWLDLLVVGVNRIDEVEEWLDNLLLLRFVAALLYTFFFSDAVSLLLLGVNLLFKGVVFASRDDIAGEVAELGVLTLLVWDRPVRAVDIGDGSTGAFFRTVGDVVTLTPAASNDETLRLVALSLLVSSSIRPWLWKKTNKLMKKKYSGHWQE